MAGSPFVMLHRYGMGQGNVPEFIRKAYYFKRLGSPATFLTKSR